MKKWVQKKKKKKRKRNGFREVELAQAGTPWSRNWSLESLTSMWIGVSIPYCFLGLTVLTTY
jgi:hypothetical protein